MAAPWRDRPARADRARRSASARSRNGEAREHPATSTQHEIATFKRSAKQHSSSRPAVPPSSDGVESISTRSSASRYVQSDAPTANTHQCKTLCATAHNQPPADRAAKSTLLPTAASRPRPWASEGPSACRPARAGRREARTASLKTKQLSQVCCGGGWFGVGWLRA